MPPLARYPDAASPFWIEQRSGAVLVHHERLGLIAECDRLAEARFHIADLEDEEAASAAREAREIAEAEAADAAFLAALDEASGDLSSGLQALLDERRAA